MKRNSPNEHRFGHCLRTLAICLFLAYSPLTTLGQDPVPIPNPNLLYTLEGQYEDSYVGSNLWSTLVAMGDIDSDSSNDFLIAEHPNRNFRNLDMAPPSVLRAVSSRDGSVLYTLPASLLQWAGNGDKIRNIGDISGDGLADFLVRDFGGGGLVGAGLHIYNGRDGAHIRSHREEDFSSGPCPIVFLFSLQDINQDDWPDYGICCGFETADPNFFTLYSGVNGAELSTFTVRLTEPLDEFGVNSVASPGDVNSDGVSDITLGIYGQPSHGQQDRGLVLTISGSIASGTLISDLESPEVLWNTFGTNNEELYARPTIPINDLNGDQVDDMISVSQGRGTVALSGLDGSPIWNSYHDFDLPSTWPDIIGDLDGDGFQDYIATFSFWRSETSTALIVSGKENNVLHELDFDYESDWRQVISLKNSLASASPHFLITEGLTESRANSAERLHVYSFTLTGEPISEPFTPILRHLPHQTLITWPAALRNVSLERSADLIQWEVIEKMSVAPDPLETDHRHQANYYEVPPDESRAALYYRIRYSQP